MSSNGKNIIVSLLAGLGAGLVLGVLLAPNKGSDTRDKLKNLARDLEDFIRKSLDTKEANPSSTGESSSEMKD